MVDLPPLPRTVQPIRDYCRTLLTDTSGDLDTLAAKYGSAPDPTRSSDPLAIRYGARPSADVVNLADRRPRRGPNPAV